MKIKRRTALAAASATLAAPAVLSASTPKKWNMVTSWPRDLPGPGVSARRIAQSITALSKGRIVVELHAAGELVPAFGVFDAVQTGAADLAHTAAAFWYGKMPAAPFFLAVPFGLTPIEHQSWIEFGGGQALWDELYAGFNIKPFMAGNTGMSMGGWFRQALTGVDDLKGLQIRMPGLGAFIYQGLGASAVSMPPGETMQALLTGLIDAAEFAGPASDLALGFYKAAEHYYGPGFHEPNGTGECLINRSLYEELDEGQKQIVQSACRAEAFLALSEAQKANGAALDALMTRHGLTPKAFPKTIITQARAIAVDLYQSYEDMGSIEQKIVRSYLAAREELGSWSEQSIAPYLQERSG